MKKLVEKKRMQRPLTRIALLVVVILLSLTACSLDIEEEVEEEPLETAAPQRQFGRILSKGV